MIVPSLNLVRFPKGDFESKTSTFILRALFMQDALGQKLHSAQEWHMEDLMSKPMATVEAPAARAATMEDCLWMVVVAAVAAFAHSITVGPCCNMFNVPAFNVASLIPVTL